MPSATRAPSSHEAPALRVRFQAWMAVVILASTLAIGAVGYVLAQGLAPSQVASVDLLVLPNQQGRVDEALVRTFESVVTADAFAAEIKEASLSPALEEMTDDQVAASIATRRRPTSSLVEVRVTRPDAASALAIAQRISPTVDELLTVGGGDPSSFYRQVFPEPLLREESALSPLLGAAVFGFFGFLLGGLGVAAWALRRPVVTTTKALQELSGYPLIARLPDRSVWWRRGQSNVVDPLLAVVEQVRDTGVTERGGVVAIVSPDADATRSFSIEFATALAQTDDRPVFLLDGDFRRARLTRSLDVSQQTAWNQWDLSAQPPGPVCPEELLDRLERLPAEPGLGDDRMPILVPVSETDDASDRVRADQLKQVLDVLSPLGAVIAACPPVPGDVPAAPAIIAAKAVLIIAKTGAISRREIALVGEMVASLTDAPAGIVVIGEGQAT